MSVWSGLWEIVTFGAKESDRSMALEGTVIERRESAAGILPINRRSDWPTPSPGLIEANYSRMALIFRCVQLVATSMASGHLRVYTETSTGQKSIDDHPLRLLMTQPNPQMRENTFLSLVGVNIVSTGFCVIEKERSRAGRVINLWPLRSDRMKAIPRGAFQYDWEYQIPGSTRVYRIPAENAIVITYADSPSFSPFGIGPIEVAFREAAMLNQMGDFIKAFFDGGAIPLLGIIPDLEIGDRMTQAEIDELDQRFAERHLGLDKAVRPVWLQNIKDIKPIGYDMNALAYLDLRDLSELAICQAFGIHPLMVSARFGLEHSDTRANSREGRRSFYEDVIQPLWARIDDVFTLDLLKEFTDDISRLDLSFDVSDIDALQDDRNAKAPWVTQLATAGLISQYVVFDELGIRRPTTPDFYLRPISMDIWPVDDPLGESIVSPEPAVSPPAGPGDPDPVVPDQGADPEDDEGRAAIIRLVDREGTRAAQRMIRSSRPNEFRRARFATQSKRTISRMTIKHAKMYDTFFKQQLNRILAAGRSGASIGAEYRGWSNINWNEEELKLARVQEQVVMNAGSAAYDQIERETGYALTFNVSNQRVRDVIGQVVTRPKGITAVSQKTREDVGRIVAEGQVNGLRAEAIADQIRGLYEETYANRSLTIARTETMVSYGYASAAGYRETGLVDRIQCFDNHTHDEDYGAEDGLTCATRDGFIDDLDSAELHIDSEHPNGSLVVSPVLIGEEVEPGGSASDVD